MIELLITTIFLIFIVLREYQHQKGVELLMKALIAKNVYELKEVTDSKVNEEEDIPKFIPTDQVSDEEFLSAIQKDLKKESPEKKFKEKIVEKIWPKSTKS